MKQNTETNIFKITYIAAFVFYMHLHVETECDYNRVDLASAGETIANLFLIYFFYKIKNFIKNTFVIYIIISILSLFVFYNINILYSRFFEVSFRFVIYIIFLNITNLCCMFLFHKNITSQ